MADILDYKKKYRDLYSPKTVPAIIEVPKITFAAAAGQENPNDKNGEYQKSVEILYGIEYAIKMSKKENNIPAGYFDYVVPPLKGLWWFDNNTANWINDKSKYNWLSIIRLPEFVTKDV